MRFTTKAVRLDPLATSNIFAVNAGVSDLTPSYPLLFTEIHLGTTCR
jgi:hypothetical protein